ncbi:hypothetical protein NRF20_20740 [Streptomyces sp. R-74717]|uniref:hypothetical protein n=1 Tax=Streptomyces sp. R-74717 TaxID=2969820 RepID=UPI0039B42E04
MTMMAKVDGEWAEVPGDDEKVLDRYSAAVPLVWAPPYFGASPEYSWVPLYDENGRGSFEEQVPEPERSELERLADRTARGLKGFVEGGMVGERVPLEELLKATVRARLKDEYVFTGGMHDWFADECGRDCRTLAEKDVEQAAEKLRKAITRIAGEVVAEMSAVPRTADEEVAT